LISHDFPEWSIDKISAKTGIVERGIAGANEFVSDMAEKAALKLFEEYDVDRSKIDFILLCTQSPDYFLPTTACVLQHKLNISTSAGALDFNLGCSGYVYGLAIAKGLIESQIAKNVLLITSEIYSKHIHPKDKSNRTIFGDAAAASLISGEEVKGGEICKFELGTDGSGAEHLIVKEGGMRNKISTNLEYVQKEDSEFQSPSYLYMNGQEVFAFTIKIVPSLVKNVLAKHDLEMDQIDLFVFHQANKFMMEHLQKKLKISDETFFIFLENCGNTVSSTIPIALYEAEKRGKLKKGMTVLLAGFGVGLSWAGTIIKY
jgi:3-oxoacyl-[acyl-carrier-protein] synthase III